MIVNDYTDTLFLSKGTVRHRNPKHFTKPKPCDYVKSNHQHILDAYAEVGIPQWPEDKNGVQKEEKEEEWEKPEVVDIPDNWESLPFFTQRSIARKIDSTVNTKEDVLRVLKPQQ